MSYWGRQRQPPASAEINWGHPLAYRLRGLWIFSDLGPAQKSTGYSPSRNRVTQKPVYGALSSVVSTGGMAMHLVNNYSAFLAFGTGASEDRTLLPANSVTVFIIRQKTDLTVRYGALFGTGFDPATGLDATSAAYLGARTPAGPGDSLVYWYFGGTSSPNSLTWSGYTVTANVEYWTFTAGYRGSQIYFNGVLRASQSTPITRTATPSLEFQINNFDLIGNGDDQYIYAIGIAHREWTASEVAAWYAD